MKNKKEQKIEEKLQEILNKYNEVVTSIEEKAKNVKGRTYGGMVRSAKGDLVENIITEQLVRIAWENVSEEGSNRLSFESRMIKIPIKKEYIDGLKNSEVKKHILQNIEDYYYRIKVDKHVYVDGQFVLGIECKSYTENAMLKRILVDFKLLKEKYPQIVCLLLQLESQLGGDYSKRKQLSFGSSSTHTLLSYFDVDLHIITLLEGERKVDRPVHKKEFYKPLEQKSLREALLVFTDILRKYK